MRGFPFGARAGRLSIGFCAGIALASGTTASAQTTTPEATRTVEPVLEEITVTARKREESVLDAPLSVSAFDATKLENAGLFDVNDIAEVTPGFSFAEQGNVWPGRLYSQIFFRGMAVTNPTPKDQVGALFVDGIYYLGAASSLNTFDVERVEVLKGPQNAYFGRNTFGGALNFIMRTPTGEPRTNIETDVTHEGSYKMAFGNEGTLVPDKLLYRVSLSKYHKAPFYTAQDGGQLGEQNSTNVAVTLFAEPTDRWAMRLRVQFGEDEDGSPAAAFLPGTQYNTCGGTKPYSRYAEDGTPTTVYPNNYVCGRVPTISQLGEKVVTRNTSLNSPTLAARGFGSLLTDIVRYKSFESYLASNVNPAVVAITRNLLDEVPDLDGLGLHRKYWLTSLNSDFTLTDSLTLSALFGYNRAVTFQAHDSDGQDAEAQIQINANKSVDKSAELRLTWDNGGPLTALVGVNYYEQLYDGSFTGVLSVRPTGAVIVGLNGNSNGTQAEVLGFFGSLNYTFLEDFRLTLEGRYQKDTVRNVGNRLDIQEVSFTDFLPRVIVSWLPEGRSTNVYASYAKGVIPGQHNAALFDPTILPSERDRLSSTLGATPLLDSEELDAYEIGWKQRFPDLGVYFNFAAYYMEWQGQKLNASLPVMLVDGSITNKTLYVPADIDLQGFELEAGWRPTHWLELEGTLNWTDSEYQRGLDNNVRTLSGTGNVKGLRIARFPEWSGSLAGTVSGVLGTTQWDWYSRLDLRYTGKQFVDPANLAYIGDYVTANLRGGIRNDNWRIEAYVRNLTDEDTWTGGARLIQLIDNASQGILLSAPDKREIGLRISVDF